MPEFAEVNKQVRWLRERVTGWRPDGVESRGPNLPELKGDPARQAKIDAFFLGATLTSVTQRGKHVVMAFTSGTLVSHLMFAGRWSLGDEAFTSNYKHHRDAPDPKAVTFTVRASGRALNFHEPEFRGKVQSFPGVTAKDVPDLKALGPDVLITPETDPAFTTPWTVQDLVRAASKTRTAVKALLLDQKKMAGIGNMYACESLYRAGIRPDRVANTLTPAELGAVHAAVQSVIGDCVASDLDYATNIAVYRRETDHEGHKVETMDIGGRETFWVPAKQR